MKKLDLRLLRLIKDSKGQFFSISLVLIIAIAVFLSMNMAGDNLGLSLEAFYDNTNFSDLFIKVTKIPEHKARELENIQGIERVQGRISRDLSFKSLDPNEKVRVRVLSLPQKDYILNDNYLVSGQKDLSDPKDALLLEQFAEARGLKTGDKISILYNGREYDFNVLGIVANPEFVYLMENEVNLLTHPDKFGIVYITEEKAQNIFNSPDSWDELLIKLDHRYIKNKGQIKDQIEDSLKNYGLISIIEKENQLSYSIMEMEVDQTKKMSWAMTIFFLFSAGLIIYIMLSRLVSSDRTSIGVLKALGYSNRSLINHYIKYSLFIALVSSVLGILLSIPLLSVITDLFLLYMNVPALESSLRLGYFLMAILLCLLACLPAGFLGSKKALEIMPAQAMEKESPPGGKKLFLENFPTFWQALPFDWRMVFRNAFRNKKRALVLLLGISISTALTMVPLYMSLIWDGVFDHHYKDFQKMDYHLTFSRPYNDKILFDLKKIAEIEYLEAKVELPFEVSKDWKKKNLTLVGIPQDTIFYNFENLKGERIFLQEDQVILSEISAKVLGAKEGDILSLKNFLPGKDDFQVRVSAINKQNLGLNIYMDIDALNKHLKEPGMTTGALIKSSDQDLPGKVLKLEGVAGLESIQEMLETFKEYLEMVMASVLILLLFAGILAFAIVYNVTIINIRERSMEISVLRVLGFEKVEIFKLINKENILVGIFGILAGLPLGKQMCKGVVYSISQELMSIPLSLKTSTYLLAAFITLLFILIAQMATIRKIYNINFLDALKSRIS